MRLLVIGRNGQLARALARDSEANCVDRLAFDLARADIAAARDLLNAHTPGAVINAAAYTRVDQAERDVDAAFALNQHGPRALALACAEVGAPLVHISTDYVFDGLKRGAYAETDPTNPQSVYGASKAAGETDVLQSGARAAIVRTSWLYAAEGANFLRTMLRVAQERDEISVVADQHGSPTWASDLAAACRAIAERLAARDAAAEGVLHYTGAGETTWADFAEAIFDNARARGWRAATVKRVLSVDFPTAAKRPGNSRLDASKITALLGPCRPWREALDLCMQDIRAP